MLLDNLPHDVDGFYADYELSNLIVESYCIGEEEKPPQNMRLKLPRKYVVSVDIIVISNQGFCNIARCWSWNVFIHMANLAYCEKGEAKDHLGIWNTASYLLIPSL